MSNKTNNITLINQAQKGDLTARNKFIELNMGLVINTVRNHYKNYSELQNDLISEGVFGLINAIENFDTKLGNCFSTYALPCITRSINTFISEQTKSFKVSRDIVHKSNEVKQYYNSLNSNLSEEEKIQQVAKFFGNSEKKCRELLRFNPFADSFETAFQKDDDENSVSEKRERDWKTPTPTETFESNLNLEAVKKGLEILKKQDPRMYFVVTEHFGFNDKQCKGKSFSAIGKQIGLSRQQACNISKSALEFLRDIPELQNVA